MSAFLNFATIILTLICVHAFVDPEQEYRHLCDDLEPETFSSFEDLKITRFYTENIRVKWANGEITELGNLEELRNQQDLQDRQNWKIIDTKGRIESYAMKNHSLEMPEMFLLRLFGDKVEINLFEGNYEVPRIICDAKFDLEFNIGGRWLSVSSDTLIQRSKVDGEGKKEGDGEGKKEGDGEGKKEGDGAEKSGSIDVGKSGSIDVGKSKNNGAGKPGSIDVGKSGNIDVGKSKNNGTGKSKNNGAGKSESIDAGTSKNNGAGKSKNNGAGKPKNNGAGKPRSLRKSKNNSAAKQVKKHPSDKLRSLKKSRNNGASKQAKKLPSEQVKKRLAKKSKNVKRTVLPDREMCEMNLKLLGNFGYFIYYGDAFWHHVCMSPDTPNGELLFSQGTLHKTKNVKKLAFAQKPLPENAEFIKEWTY